MDGIIKDLGDLTVEGITTIISSQAGNAAPYIGPVANIILKRGFDKVINDVVSRQLSKMQKARVNEVRDFAILTFYKLAEENNWNDNSSESADYTQTIAESIEDVFNKAVNECRRVKRIMLGALLGSILYHSNITYPEIEHFFYVSTIIDRLTFRQLCLISLIGNHFKDITPSDKKQCITDETAISELKDMQSLGFWQPIFSHMGPPEEHPLPIDYLVPNAITLIMAKDIIFPDEIKDDYYRAIKSLKIDDINPSAFPEPFLKSLEVAINKKQL